MKKFVVAAGMLMAMGSYSAMAANNGPGCGLGTQIWKGQSGLFAHTSAATTNSSVSYNQLFGLTSGTLGCNGDESVVSNEYQKKEFVASNMDDLAQDAAQGNGAYLDSLATLLGIEEQDKGDFYSFAQSNYQSIFSANNSDYESVLAALDNSMAGDARFVKYVR